MNNEKLYFEQFRGDETSPEDRFVEWIIKELTETVWDFPTLIATAEILAHSYKVPQDRVRPLIRKAVYDWNNR